MARQPFGCGVDMNTTQIKSSELHTAIKEKLKTVEANYNRELELLAGRAWRNCSWFETRRTQERASKYLSQNYGVAKENIERDINLALDRLRGLNKLIKMSETNLISVDADTALWLWGD